MADGEEDAGPKVVWEGEFDENHVPHGKGTMKYPPAPKEEDAEEEEGEEKPGDTFEGELVHGIREGHGKYKWASGAVYEGEYSGGLKHGQGKLTLPDGSNYEGGWVSDKMHGEGRYAYASGDIYQGGFRFGAKDGRGSYYFKATESQYIGNWREGVFVNGMWALKDGSRFQGQFDAQQEGLKYTSKDRLTQTGVIQKNGQWRAMTAIAAEA